jgi:kelch-like protein 2/3
MFNLYQVGGYDGASRQCLSSVECYNPETDSWSPVVEMSVRRSGAGKAEMECYSMLQLFI